MPIITSADMVTQINVFTCEPADQPELLALLREAAQSVRDVDGWISASLHREIEGSRVVNYAQCRDMAAWQRVMARLRAGGFLERNRALGVAHPGLYEVDWVLDRGS
jgi:quinol monooxygenase YgiN